MGFPDKQRHPGPKCRNGRLRNALESVGTPGVSPAVIRLLQSSHLASTPPPPSMTALNVQIGLDGATWPSIHSRQQPPSLLHLLSRPSEVEINRRCISAPIGDAASPPTP